MREAALEAPLLPDVVDDDRDDEQDARDDQTELQRTHGRRVSKRELIARRKYPPRSA